MSRIKIATILVASLSIVLVITLLLRSDPTESPVEPSEPPSPPAVRHLNLPLEYGIGRIDERFGITRERVEELAEEACRVWENAAGRTLMNHNEESAFKVNLVFDWRQEKLNAAREARSALDENGSSFDKVQDEYNHRLSTIETSRSTLRDAARSFEARLANYNDRVARWNEGTDRTEREQRALQTLKSDIESERAELEAKRTELNNGVEELNKLAEDLNEMARKFNLEVDNFNGTFVRSREFEKGVFDGSSINIYEFEKEEDLKVALIHEFGHALGLGHTDNPASIMHRKLALQDLTDIHLSEEDIAQLRARLKE